MNNGMPKQSSLSQGRGRYNPVYRRDRLNHVAFPMGGIGAGMLCLEGAGAFSHVSVRHKPEIFNEPLVFAALHVQGAATARLLEGPAPMRKAFGGPGAGNGCGGRSYGLPRFAAAEFQARFPFGVVRLKDPAMPVTAELTGWSPFIPGDADSACLPVAAVEYRIRNRTAKALKATFSFHAANFMTIGDGGDGIRPTASGFILTQSPACRDQTRPGDPILPGAAADAAAGAFAVFTGAPGARIDCAWFRGHKLDFLTMLWNTIAAGQAPARKPHAAGEPGRGGSLFVPFKLQARAEKTIRILFAWHVPRSDIRVGADPHPNPPPGGAAECACNAGQLPGATYEPWYASRFKDIGDVASYWRKQYKSLRAASRRFSDCFYDTSFPPEVIEAVAANLAILKSPTCLRDSRGRFWGWEGCCDSCGCCYGSCTHVWNYAQALPHLFPALERSLRETEFEINQDKNGHQNFRASLPLREPAHTFHAAADGQLGGLIKLYRDWRISGDTAWMRRLWPKARQSLDYCIATWDPQHTGLPVEPHHNTYDIEFWGPDGMCASFYLSALQAASAMARAGGESAAPYDELLAKGKKAMATKLWNGEYFIQQVQWRDLRAPSPETNPSVLAEYSPEGLELLREEGPKYQYGNGCLSDGVLGDWMARVSGLAPALDPEKVAGHLASVYKYNFRANLTSHANPQRPAYAFGREGGLLLCSWPRGGQPSLPFIYSNEVWTGIEYQVASHLIMLGRAREGLRIVRTARDRYDGRHRNPFNEYECGHWYARAMSSYSLLQALSGARYDAVEKTLYLKPALKGDFRAFISTATGYGTVGIRKGKPFLAVRAGVIDARRIVVAR